jgi:hypothetical protein|tara:strand:- start:449 stop:673 length:225 start_codon:yes stop_codon:yes gene_type:complete
MNYDNSYTITGNGWLTCYSVGDLVKTTDGHIGFVAKPVQIDQELLFPFVPVYCVRQHKVMEYQVNSVQIISKAG